MYIHHLRGRPYPYIDLIAQLVEHSNGIAEVRVRVPIRSEFFSLSRYFLGSAQNCEDHALKMSVLQCAHIFSISFPFDSITVSSLLRSRLSGCHATLPRKKGALRDIPKDGCEGDYTVSNAKTIHLGQFELPSDLDVTIIFHQCPATFQPLTCGFFSCVLVLSSLRHPQSQREASSMRKTSLTKSSRVVLVT